MKRSKLLSGIALGLIDLPVDKKPIKLNGYLERNVKLMEIDRFKARLVAKGYKQNASIDY